MSECANSASWALEIKSQGFGGCLALVKSANGNNLELVMMVPADLDETSCFPLELEIPHGEAIHKNKISCLLKGYFHR